MATISALSAIKIEQPIQNVQGIVDRSRADDGTQTGHLVVEIVQPGQAAALAEVARIRPGIDGGYRRGCSALRGWIFNDDSLRLRESQ